jgi:hypothetical protein
MYCLCIERSNKGIGHKKIFFKFAAVIIDSADILVSSGENLRLLQELKVLLDSKRALQGWRFEIILMLSNCVFLKYMHFKLTIMYRSYDSSELFLFEINAFLSL